MKAIIKVIVITIIFIVVIISIPIVILAIPINHVEIQIDTTNGSKEDLVKDQLTQIYVDSYPESPGWIVYGKDGVMFEESNKAEHIFLVGNFPKKINHDLINTNRFVLNGKYIGIKKRKGVIAECFYVESWGILGKIKREHGLCENFSKSSLTLADRIFEDPILVYDLDEFEEVDDSEVSK